ncbi:hypothetical protein [Antarctobacter heliothermus]|uniref:Uncharacterized protein n=1 Tax=Antarctobacter heliothermus TaxID=74033 RepID=A0A239MD41_9RHOB|nr:hypothetical protein [Antarctobacter heliothermus]SNT39974.1 hypothetical protein SAMN04488078_11401 [Antarctobacter heliothermus]
MWTEEQRDEVARILNLIAEDGLPHPRNLDATLDAIQQITEPEAYLDLSVCVFQSGDIDVMMKDETGQKMEINVSGFNLGPEDLDFINKNAPACVWTRYGRITPCD